ncbi:MAG: tetratricopeptide repeat protein [Verrucomicrobia bacterium]|nr:tetratricopeptide repeat protein [Verrucomicrobiota bacterium]
MTSPEQEVPPVLNQPASSKGGSAPAFLYLAVGASCCLLSFMTVAAVTFSLPKIFESQARIQISPPTGRPVQPQPGVGLRGESTPLQTHAQRLRSEPVLLQVVKEENLATKWAIAGPEETARRQCVEFLKHRVTTQPVHGTNLIEIVSLSIDPTEAADVANRIAKVYGDIVGMENKGEVVEISKIATPPTTHSKPNIPLYLGVGFLGAALLGAMVCGLIFLVDRAKRRFNIRPPLPQNAARDGGRKKRLFWLVRIAAWGVLALVVSVKFKKGDFHEVIADFNRVINQTATNNVPPWTSSSARDEQKPSVTSFTGKGGVDCQVTGIPQGAYSKKMFADIGRHWTQLLEQNYTDGQPGRVKLSFTLHPTGHVDHLKVAQNTALPILGKYCQKAVMDCVPFDPWPQELKLLGEDHLDITITFNVYLLSDQCGSGQSPPKSDPKNARAYRESGIAKLEKNDFDGAIANFSRVIELDARNADAYVDRGIARNKKGDFDGSMADLNRAIELVPKYAVAYGWRGLDKFNQHDYDGAIADYDQAVKLDPKESASLNWSYVEAYFCRGDAKLEKGDFDGVIADFSRVIELDPKNSTAYTARGMGKSGKGDLDGAIADYSRAIELDPKIVSSYFHRGEAKRAQGDLKGAILDYSRFIEINPKHALAYYERGITKHRDNDLNGAIADYTHAIELNPDHPLAYCGRGSAYGLKDEDDKAIVDYTRAIELDPKYARAFSDRGIVFRYKGDYDKAIVDLSQAIQLDPKDADAYYERGIAKHWKADLDGAIADYSHAIELNPKDANAYTKRGSAYFMQRSWAAALVDKRRCCELNPLKQDYSQVMIWIIRARLNEKAEANKELAAYLEKRGMLGPDNWPVKIADFLLGRISESDLIAAANSSDAKKERSQHCQLWFYAGMKTLLTGDKTGAADCFRKVLATDAKNAIQYHLAKAELKALGQ